MTWSVEGKTCLITGANTGIGYQTALGLAKRGSRRVILACRNLKLGNEAAGNIKRELDSPCDVQVAQLNLSSLSSVRKCVEKLNGELEELQVLVCNAGVHANDRIVTEDGFELGFQVNHLGHFLLVNLLRPLLKKSKPSRIVVVASDAYKFRWPWGLDVDDLNMEKPESYGSFKSYCQSKLANILYVHHLNKILNEGQQATSGIAVFSVHPGFVKTTMAQRHQSAWFLSMIEWLHKWFSVNPEQGAATTLHCCCEPYIENHFSGCYFSNSQVVTGWQLLAIAIDDRKAEQLWIRSMQMTGADTSSSINGLIKTGAGSSKLNRNVVTISFPNIK